MNKIKEIITSSIHVKQQLLENEQFIQLIASAVHAVTQQLKAGNRIIYCGNGGSAADAQHLAAEFTGRFYLDRTALPAEALHCNTSYLTAVANDYGFDVIYSRMIQGTCRAGDVLIALSTSGNSKNIVEAMRIAKEKNMITIAMTGESGGSMKAFSDYLFNVPSKDTPRIQETHIMIGHIICQLVEEQYFALPLDN